MHLKNPNANRLLKAAELLSATGAILSGITFAMKNHFGSTQYPGTLHSGIARKIAALNALPDGTTEVEIGPPASADGGFLSRLWGDVVLLGDASLSTLLPLTPRPHYRATNGRPGMDKSKHGADGAVHSSRISSRSPSGSSGT